MNDPWYLFLWLRLVDLGDGELQSSSERLSRELSSFYSWLTRRLQNNSQNQRHTLAIAVRALEELLLHGRLHLACVSKIRNTLDHIMSFGVPNLCSSKKLRIASKFEAENWSSWFWVPKSRSHALVLLNRVRSCINLRDPTWQQRTVHQAPLRSKISNLKFLKPPKIEVLKKSLSSRKKKKMVTGVSRSA